MYCCEACGDKGGGKKGQCRIGLAVRENITRAVVHPPEFINGRLLKAILKSRGRASAFTFLGAYGPAESTRDYDIKQALWAALDGDVKEARTDGYQRSDAI